MNRINVISIKTDSAIPIREAMQAIQRGACWIAFVVDEENRLLGLVTDGDARRALLAGASMDDLAEPHMQKRFTSVAPDVGRSEVLDLMRARSLNQIPIVDERGRLVGLHLMREIVGAVHRPNWAVVMAGSESGIVGTAILEFPGERGKGNSGAGERGSPGTKGTKQDWNLIPSRTLWRRHDTWNSIRSVRDLWTMRRIGRGAVPERISRVATTAWSRSRRCWE